jgi:DNA polymerase III subunit delta'
MNALDKIENQNLASRILKGVLKTGRIANTYLFIGSDGTGKKFAALQFAKALNCSKGGCEECPSCIKIEKFSHPDVHLITPEPEKNVISIERMRSMQREAYLGAFISRFKIYIIEEAGRMSGGAANSLLKILEEPPEDTIFILTTSGPQDIFPTIISRCQTVRFTQKPELSGKNSKISEKILPLMETDEIPDIFREIKNITGKKEEVLEIIDLLASRCRDILLLKEKSKKPVSEDSLVCTIEDILRARHLLARNVNPRLTLEMLLLKINNRI